jgi:hypothetical protein
MKPNDDKCGWITTYFGGVQYFLDLSQCYILASFLCEIFGLLLHHDLNIA